MNRIEIVGLFTALKELVKEGNIKGIDAIVTAVLEEAIHAKKTETKAEPKDKKNT